MDSNTVDALKVGVPVIASLVVAVIAMVTSFANSRKVASSNEKLAELTSKLRDEESKRDARRDYEYEALKRLYTECEPLLFQFFELAENAESRIRALARECRRGNLRQDGGGWLAGENYFFNSTAYRFFAPIAAIRILHRRLTAVDLALDSRLRTQYRLLRMLYRSFTEDQIVAQRSPTLIYDPDRADPEERGRESLITRRPETYARQGMYRGTLDRLADAMIIRERRLERVMSFGEFLQFKQDEKSQLSLVMPEIRILLLGFHPLARPVLWRVLVAQKLTYDALNASRDIDRAGPDEIPFLIPRATDEYLTSLDWRGNQSGAHEEQSDAHEETVESTVAAARAYIIDNVQA
jgi:hypothetical protein